MSSGRKSNRCCRNISHPDAAAGPGRTTARYLRASSGYCEPAPLGQTCPSNIQALRPAGDGCETGKNRISGLMPGGPFWPSSINRGNWIGRKPLPMAVLHRPKKGRMRRKDQTRQGNEVDGGGRRPRYSFGKPPGQCVPGRSHAARKNDRQYRRTAFGPRPSQTKSPVG